MRKLTNTLLSKFIFKRYIEGHLPIYINTKLGGLRYFFKKSRNWDLPLISCCKKIVRRNDIIWDIGSNLGLFSILSSYLSRQNGQVFSFEADDLVCRILRKSAAMQPKTSSPIKVVCTAIGSDNSLALFNYSDVAATNHLNGYGSTQSGNIKLSSYVPVLTLDTLCVHIPKPDVVKIDVEGAELDVINGGTELITSVRPVFHIETRSNNAKKLSEIFLSENYVIISEENFVNNVYSKITSMSLNSIVIPIEKEHLYVS